MADSKWIFATNIFLNATKGSFRLMNLLASDFNSKLLEQQNVPALVSLRSSFHPEYMAFATLYSNWLASRGEYMGATQQFTDLLNSLSSELAENWDSRILSVHHSRTSTYRKLMPNLRGGLQRGSYDDRILEVARLYKALENETGLVQLRSEVGQFHTDLVATRELQQSIERKVSRLSSELDSKRFSLSVAMYGALGDLMSLFRHKPEEVENFFELEYIRQTGGSDSEELSPALMLGLNPGSTVETGIALTGSTLLRISNTGATSLKLCMSPVPAPPCTDGRVLQPGESLDVTAADLGWKEGDFLIVTNVHAGISGSVEVYLL